jgi:hypothetical protein
VQEVGRLEPPFGRHRVALVMITAGMTRRRDRVTDRDHWPSPMVTPNPFPIRRLCPG